MKDAVAVLDPDVRINQQILLGLSETLQQQEDWDVGVLSTALSKADLARRLRKINPHAIVARGRLQELAYLVRDTTIKLVSVVHDEPDIHVPVVTPDHEAIGAMAAEYLLAQGFEHVAVFQYHIGLAAHRLGAFCQKIKPACKSVERFDLSMNAGADRPFSSKEPPRELLAWLRHLPKPCAIFANSDQPGAYIIRICRRNGIQVPEEICVLGVDDDPLFCHTVKPNLASIHVPYRRIGIEAARMILDWAPGRRVLKVPPSTVVERASVRPPRVGDPLVDLAVEHIRKEVTSGVRVRDLQEITGLSPHQLVYRFNIVTGRTPMDTILGQRIAVARQLLMETSLPVAEVALQSGFNSATQFYVTFRERVGMPPSTYRTQCLG